MSLSNAQEIGEHRPNNKNILQMLACQARYLGETFVHFYRTITLLLLVIAVAACGEAGTPASPAASGTAAPDVATMPAAVPATPNTQNPATAAAPAPTATVTALQTAASPTLPASVQATLSATPPAAPTDEAPTLPTVSPGDFERTVQVDGKPRTYLIHIPPTDTQIDAMPFLLVLHGEGATARSMVATTQFNTKSDKDTFVVAYANGSATGAAWSAADLPFITALLDDVLRKDLVDPERVYVTGFGGGGQMAYRLAQTLPDRISAIAAVDATPAEQKSPASPVALLAIHHKNDAQAPYAQAAQVVAAWAKGNGCGATPGHETLGADAGDFYSSCDAGADVFFYTLNSGAHAWPATVGTAKTVDLIWSFFTDRTP